MYIFRVPKTVLKILERIRAKFFGVLMLVNVGCFGLVGIKFWVVKMTEVLGLVVSSPSTMILFSNRRDDFLLTEMLIGCKSLNQFMVTMLILIHIQFLLDVPVLGIVLSGPSLTYV